MEGLTQKRLIQYSQYLNLATMKLETEYDYERQRQGQAKLFYAMTN